MGGGGSLRELVLVEPEIPEITDGGECGEHITVVTPTVMVTQQPRPCPRLRGARPPVVDGETPPCAPYDIAIAASGPMVGLRRLSVGRASARTIGLRTERNTVCAICDEVRLL
jgi:hypothetical protein